MATVLLPYAAAVKFGVCTFGQAELASLEILFVGAS
jgi:hypothetical protein